MQNRKRDTDLKNFYLVGNQYAKPDSDISKMCAACAD